ncbi:MAG: hypothetical protein ACYC6Y_01620 [Thermoguttaceae bacterium]
MLATQRWFALRSDAHGLPCCLSVVVSDAVGGARYRVEELSSRPGPHAARARELWAGVENRLSKIDFRGSTGSAAQGDWTGRKEIAPDGGKIVSGDHKMANGLSFDDYDRLRRQIADAVVELQKGGD